MNKKMLNLILVLALGMLICLPSIASAWTYRIGEDGQWGGQHYAIDKMEFFIISGGPFADPSQTDFSAAGWHATLVNPQYSLATGPGAGSLYWTFNFAGPADESVTLDWLAYSGGNLLGDVRVTFTGPGGSFTYDTSPVSNPASYYDRAPLPATILLLGTGLLGLIGLRRQFKGGNKDDSI
jgi:hypothetical protein